MEEKRGDGLLSRREFRAWVERHDDDPYAHGVAFRERDGRLSRLEIFQQRLIGGFLVLTLVASSGVVIALAELFRPAR